MPSCFPPPAPLDCQPSCLLRKLRDFLECCIALLGRVWPFSWLNDRSNFWSWVHLLLKDSTLANRRWSGSIQGYPSPLNLPLWCELWIRWKDPTQESEDRILGYAFHLNWMSSEKKKKIISLIFFIYKTWSVIFCLSVSEVDCQV